MQTYINWAKLYFLLAKSRRALQRLFSFSTLGVKALVINEHNQVLLVEHTYITGWHFPGGGVSGQETPAQAVIRELKEETGILATDPALFALYTHQICGARDYPVLFIVKNFTPVALSAPCPHEIKQIGWFDVDKLPLETTDCTRERLREYLQNLPPSPYW